MKISKWGNSLAVRLPTEIVKQLGVKEGDEIYAVPGMAEEPAVTFKRKKTRDELWARVDAIAKKAKRPEGYKFDRNEIYDERLKRFAKHD